MPDGRGANSKPFRISKPATTRALGSATRQEIVDALASAGPSTVARLADLLGRRPDALYFHLRALERVGLVRQQSQTDPGAGVIYQLPGSAIKLDYTAAPRTELVRVVRNAIKLSLREFERECLADRSIGNDDRRILWGGRVMGWVNQDDLAQINGHVEALHAILRSGRPGPDRRAISLGFLLAPSGFGERSRVSRKPARAHKKRGTP